MMWRILVAALVLGSFGCDREAAEAPIEKQRQEQAFVAAVGRSPSLGKIDDLGKTDLHMVAELNLPMLAISLLKQGANVNARHNYGGTPLHIGGRGGCFCDRRGLAQARSQCQRPKQQGRYAAAHGRHRADAFATAEVLLKQGANANAQNNKGFTPLHFAAFEDASATAEVLLKQGANVNAKDNNAGGTPLHHAAVWDAFATAEVLLKQGANVNAKDNEGGTPLHIAAREDAFATAEVLLKQGANVNAQDNKGITPLHSAAV